MLGASAVSYPCSVPCGSSWSRIPKERTFLNNKSISLSLDSSCLQIPGFLSPFPFSFLCFLYFSSHGLPICFFFLSFWLLSLSMYLIFPFLPLTERHWRIHLSSELDFFPVHNKKLRFEIGQRQIASEQMRSCVHQETGYNLGSWMTAKVWKSCCQSTSAPSPCDWHPPPRSLKTPSLCWSSTLLVLGHLLQPLSRTEGFQMSQKAVPSLE